MASRTAESLCKSKTKTLTRPRRNSNQEKKGARQAKEPAANKLLFQI